MPKTLKLAVSTDIHRGPDKMTKVGSAAVLLLKDFALFAQAYQPNFITELGDPIPDIDTATDRQKFGMIAV